MLSLLRTQKEQLKWTLKREKSVVKVVRKRAGVLRFTIDFSRFEVHFSCSVWVRRRDGISGHSSYESTLGETQVARSQPRGNPRGGRTKRRVVC